MHYMAVCISQDTQSKQADILTEDIGPYKWWDWGGGGVEVGHIQPFAIHISHYCD
jgi:hypothetical protein